MGGAIQVQSAPGQGSTFSFSVTLTRAEKALQEDRTALSLKHASNAAILVGKMVLVADDASAQPCNSNALSAADVTAAAGLLEALRRSLSSDLKQALKQTRELETLLAHTTLASEIQAVSDAMNAFETDAALARLELLAEKMAATTGGKQA